MDTVGKVDTLFDLAGWHEIWQKEHLDHALISVDRVIARMLHLKHCLQLLDNRKDLSEVKVFALEKLQLLR
jgi:hypothetical protein